MNWKNGKSVIMKFPSVKSPEPLEQEQQALVKDSDTHDKKLQEMRDK